MLKPISISLSPNTEKDDILLALKLIFQPWLWTLPTPRPKKLPETRPLAENLEEEFKRYLGVKYALSFNSGRSAFLAILEAIEIKEGDEILLQAFTCNSAVNPILKLGAKPVFVDVDNTINLDPNALKKKITSKSRAVMIQHTFGWPAQIEEISKTANENNLYLIEDCAHSLGAKYRGKFCGTFGDAAFFSFGRDKIISSVFGGMAVTNDDKIGEKLKKFQEKLNFPSKFWIFQQLLHPLLMNWKILPAYAIFPFFGRMILGFLHQINILSKAVYKQEKKGKIPKYFPKRLPNALTYLALNQFKKLNRFNEHRQKIANFYEKELKNTNFNLPLTKNSSEREPNFMRYPILTNIDTDKILNQAREKRIFLDDGWRKSPIVPPDTDIEKMKYISGSCPWAEKIANSIINLPTHINISEKEAKKIIDFLKTYGD